MAETPNLPNKNAIFNANLKNKKNFNSGFKKLQ